LSFLTVSLYVIFQITLLCQFYFIFCKSVQILLFFLQASPILFFICKLVQFYFLQISPLVCFFCRKVLRSKFSPEATQASPSPGGASLFVQRHTWQPIKGRPLHKSGRGHRTHATSKNSSPVPLSIQSRSNSQKALKISRTRRTIPQTLTFPEPNSIRFKQIPWNSW